MQCYDPTYRLLGKFVEAAKDLRTACKIDFDDTADEWLKEVTPNVSERKRRIGSFSLRLLIDSRSFETLRQILLVNDGNVVHVDTGWQNASSSTKLNRHFVSLFSSCFLINGRCHVCRSGSVHFFLPSLVASSALLL